MFTYLYIAIRINIYIYYTTLCPGKAAEKRKAEKAAAKAKNMPAAPKKAKVKTEVPPVPAAAEADAEWPEDWDDEEWAEDGEDGEFPEDEHMEETGWTETISTWYVEIETFNFVPVLCGILGFGRACTWSVGMCVCKICNTRGVMDQTKMIDHNATRSLKWSPLMVQIALNNSTQLRDFWWVVVSRGNRVVVR